LVLEKRVENEHFVAVTLLQRWFSPDFCLGSVTNF